MTIGPMLNTVPLIECITECPECGIDVEVEYLSSSVCGPNGLKKIRKTTCPICRGRTYIHVDVAGKDYESCK